MTVRVAKDEPLPAASLSKIYSCRPDDDDDEIAYFTMH